MRTGRPKAPLVLSREEHKTLTSWSRLEDHAPDAVGLRARIILRAATGVTNKDVAEWLRLTPATVGKWRGRFIQRRLDGLWPQ